MEKESITSKSESMQMLKLNINIDEIIAEKLYQGKKGRYLDLVLYLRDDKDQYGNIGFAVQSMTKEERERGVKMPIIGNVKPIETKATQPTAPVLPLAQPKATAMPPNKPAPMDDNDLPF